MENPDIRSDLNKLLQDNATLIAHVEQLQKEVDAARPGWSAISTQDGDKWLQAIKLIRKIERELLRCEGDDEICRAAVSFGTTDLHFDRLSIFLSEEGSSTFRGTFGIDEFGQVVDEREARIDLVDDAETTRFLNYDEPVSTYTNAPLYASNGEIAGYGDCVLASIYDGRNVVGIVTVDNLLHKKPFSEQDTEILCLFASSLAMLIGRSNHAPIPPETDVAINFMDLAFEFAGEGLVIRDASGTVLKYNESAKRLLRQSHEQMMAFEATAPDYLVVDEDGNLIGAGSSPSERCLATQESVRGEIIGITTPDDEKSWLRVSAEPVFCKDTNIFQAVITTYADVSDLKKSQAATIAREQVYRTAISASDGVAYQMDIASDSYLFTGEQFEELTGFSPSEMTLNEWSARLRNVTMRGRCEGMASTEARELMWSGQFDRWTADYEFMRKDGVWIWLSDTSVPVRDDKGEVTGTIGIIEEITGRKQIEAELARTIQQFTQLVEVIPDVFWVVNVEKGVYEYISPNSDVTIGIPVAKLMENAENLWEFVHPDDLDLVREYTSKHKLGEPNEVEYRILEPIDGGTRLHYVHDRAFPVKNSAGIVQSVYGVCSDISESKRIEEHLLHTQKMESIGRLAGGIAHDFNNILTIILGYAEIAAQKAYADHEVSECLGFIRKSGERAAWLTSQLLAFARKQVRSPRVLNINQVVGETEPMLERLIGEGIQIEAVTSPELWNVMTDPGQIQQVLINLAVNARDAMEGSGCIKIETSNRSIELAQAEMEPDLSPGDYVSLSVSDNGPGMSDEVRTRAFEPFYTTKEVGKGTGLGLATCYGIAKQNDGYIRIATSRTGGTTIEVLLPRTTIESLENGRDAVDAPHEGTETILIVENDDALRNYASTFLAARGYHVISAPNGVEALDASEAFAGDIELLITDIIMPQMGGIELYSKLRSTRPALRALCISGQMDESDVQADGDVGFLQKPFTGAILSLKVREALDS